MRLISLTANQDSFRPVHFNPTGLSFITAVQKNPGDSDSGKSYNGVGKSLLIALIHFCLGANKHGYKSFQEKLPDWSFTLTFLIEGKTYTATRAIETIETIFLNDEALTISKFNSKMESLCFDIPADAKYLSFRSLFPFFIRPKRESYVSYHRPVKIGSDYQALLYNAYLLGLNIDLAKQKIDLRKEQERIKKSSKNTKEDPLIRDFFSKDKDVTLTVKDLDDTISKLENDLKTFQVAEDYYDVRQEADQVERTLAETQNSITLLENQLKNLEGSLQISPDVGKKAIEKVYSESKIYFPERVKKNLDQIESFYYQLTKNRKEKLIRQKLQIETQLEKNLEDRETLQKKLNDRLHYLGAHQALDVFVKVNDQLSELKNKRDRLKRFDQLMAEYQRKTLEIKEGLIQSTKKTEDYLKNREPLIGRIQDYFRRLAKRIYPHAASGITVYNNDGENTLRYTIEAKIEADASDGINNVKIFCYDLTLMFKGFGHKIHFLFHDSRLFDGIDERQKTEIFKILSDEVSSSSFQYIATVNQNQLEEIRKHLHPGEYDAIVTQNTVLTLTDHSEREKLLGIKVDLNYW
jgi:uncharacterized protein YydD (DUF2326 family)